MKEMRLDKYLADMGLGTRSEIKNKIKQGQVVLNGEMEKRPERQVNPVMDRVTVNGEEIQYISYEYYMLNKPSGYVSATSDTTYPTVLDLIVDKKRKDLFPVGRLDLDTEGLLLITNDGALSHQLLSPKKHVTKTYYAKIEGRVTKEDVVKLKEGLDIGEDALTLPAELVIQKEDEVSEIEVTITEGKFHQIKRMFEAVGKKVLFLKRLSMGNLVLDETLSLGAYRPLTEKEINDLKGK